MAQPLEKVYYSKKQIIIHNFIGGLAWALGATVGLAVVLMILSYVSNFAGVVPIIGDLIVEVNEYILQKQPQLVE